MRSAAAVVFLFLSGLCSGQLPEKLIQTRSVVLMDLPLRNDGEYRLRDDAWKKACADLHVGFRAIGIDAIGYLHKHDWYASDFIQTAWSDFFSTRRAEQMITVTQHPDGLFELRVEALKNGKTVWTTEGGSVQQCAYRLGQEVKRSGLVLGNFMFTDSPEIFEDLPLSKSQASLIYPDHVRRLKIGVVQFDDPKRNEELKRILEQSYPHTFELFQYTTDEDAYRKGYQFILLSMTTTGQTIRQMLNYPKAASENVHISTVADGDKTRLKSIPANALIFKYYIRHTVNKELFVGRQWDADITWQQALENFCMNLAIAVPPRQ
jgi:hypothetical protein